MTAAGKTNASRVQINDRIIVKVTQLAADASCTDASRTKTGEGVQIARVIGKEKCGNRRGYMVKTSAGTFYAEPVQTMWLAPEDAAGVKRARVEAEAEDIARDAVKATAGRVERDHAEAVAINDEIDAVAETPAATAPRYTVQMIDRRKGREFAYINDAVTGDVAKTASGMTEAEVQAIADKLNVDAETENAVRTGATRGCWTPLDERETEAQVAAWEGRHARLGADTSRQAYPPIAYRMADEVEAHEENARRDALAAWKTSATRLVAGKRLWEDAQAEARQYQDTGFGLLVATEWAARGTRDDRYDEAVTAARDAVWVAWENRLTTALAQHMLGDPAPVVDEVLARASNYHTISRGDVLLGATRTEEEHVAMAHTWRTSQAPLAARPADPLAGRTDSEMSLVEILARGRAEAAEVCQSCKTAGCVECTC
jgi:hypothetical protein